MAIPGCDMLAPVLGVSMECSFSILNFTVLRGFNVLSDFLVIGMGMPQPLGGSGVALTLYMALQKPV